MNIRTLRRGLIWTLSILALGAAGCSGGTDSAGTGGSAQTGGAGAGAGAVGAAGAAATGGQAGTTPDTGGTGGTSDVAVTAVGSQSAAPSTTTIGPNGGTVTSPDQRLVVSIPAGALSANTTIGVANITNTAPGGMGSAFRLTPNGQTFAVPVTLVYTPTGELDTDPTQVGLAFQTTAGSWQLVPGIAADTTAGTFTSTTTHFTDYSYVAFLQLTADSSALFVGQTETLHVVESDPVPDASGNSYVAANPHPYSGGTPSWAVNGVLTGDINAAGATYGYVGTVNGTDGVYTAPAHLPSSGNPVAVSATIAFGSSSVTLVKNIHLLAHQYHVTLSYEHQDTCAGMAQGGGAEFDLVTSTSFDITLDSDFNVTGSNFADEIDPPVVQTLNWCPFTTPVPGEEITDSYTPDQTHGIVVSAVGGNFDQTRAQLHVIPNGGMVSDFPAYEQVVTLAGMVVSDTIVPEDRSTVDFTGLFFDGKDGDTAPVYAPVAGSFSTVTIGAKLHVLQE
ncbi:MAG TPA: hypothetical protein VMT03_01495 [Polyangia bacterium]|nr:hypothetical protein [Polyangia bacterium]